MLSLLSLVLMAGVLLAPSFALAQPTRGGESIQEGLTQIEGPFPDTIVSDKDPDSLVKRLIEWALYIGAVLAVIFIIIGGYFYLTSAGNDDQAKRGRRTLTYAVIGLVIIVLSWVIVQTVYNFLTNS